MILNFDLRSLDTENLLALCSFAVLMQSKANAVLIDLDSILTLELNSRGAGEGKARPTDIDLQRLEARTIFEAVGCIGIAGSAFAAGGKLQAGLFCRDLVKAIREDLTGEQRKQLN